MSENEKIAFLEKALLDLTKKNVKLQPDMRLIDDLGLDSLDVVELQLYYEEKLGVELPETQDQLLTIRDLLNLMP